MPAKIIYLPHVDLGKIKKTPHLSKKMIEALQRACSQQHDGTPFGQEEIDGSFIPLINRGLIKIKFENNSIDDQSVWHVSKEAIDILHSLGIEIDC